jgi:phosphatidate cytidylyltransferase
MKQELIKRIITGLIIGIVLLGLLLSHKVSAVFLMAVIGLISSFELLKMAQSQNPFRSPWIPLSLVVMLYLLAIQSDLKGGVFSFFLCISLLTYCFLIWRLFNQSKSHYENFSPYFILLYPALAFFFPIAHLWTDYESAHNFLLGIVILIWASDSFAYFVGSKVGKTKMLPQVSPKKTWEGFFGGLSFAFVAGFFLFLKLGIYPIYFWLSLSLVVSAAGALGDFCESACKRHYNVKDSGKMLPGHGGFLDRFDSLVFALPFSYLLLIFFKYI